MTASFELEAHDGVITLPETMRASFNSRLRVTVSTVTSDDSLPSQAKPDYIDYLINNPVEAFTSLTREQANDRHF
jgi:hypothetical protein